MGIWKLIPDDKNSDRLTLNPESFKKLEHVRSKIEQLHFGIGTHPIKLHFSRELETREAALSKEIIEKLNIPLFAHYEWLIKNGEIQIGPYIGFLVSNYMKILDEYIDSLSDYLVHYNEIHGAVLAFTLEGVNRSNQTIRGYVYHPQTKQWVKGTYPYPSSIFIRGDVKSNRWRKYFRSLVGNTLFNDFYFDKWQMYHLLSSSPAIKKYLPETTLYTNPADIYTFLKSYSQAYIKPIHGTMGISISKVSVTDDKIILQYRENGRNRMKIFTDYNQAQTFFSLVLQEKKFIIQQALDLISYQREKVDFRLIIVKNGSGHWEYMGAVARYGAKDSIISNISAGGKAEKGEEALKKILQLTESESRSLAKKMCELAMEVAKHLDQTGLHCGNMGIDLAVDKEKKIWIIEIQHHSPAHSIALDAKDTQMYEQTLRNNMLYLKKLSGFVKNQG